MVIAAFRKQATTITVQETLFCSSTGGAVLIYVFQQGREILLENFDFDM